MAAAVCRQWFGLHRAGGQQGVAALGQRVRQQQFQLARLVAAAGEAGLVVAFDPELEAEAEVGSWQARSGAAGMEWRGQEGERIARQVGG